MGIEKLIQYVLIAVLGSSSGTVLVTREFDKTTVITLVVTALGALGVFWTKNTPSQPWAKQAVAVFAAAVLVLTSAWTDHVFTAEEIVAVLLAALGAWQVGTVANTERAPISA